MGRFMVQISEGPTTRKPIIITVDDDREVLQAIAQDVRRAYFEVETALGSRLWLFRDPSTQEWRCHGAFS